MYFVVLKLLILLFIFIVPLQSDAASLIHIFRRQLSQESKHFPHSKLLVEMSPSPTPSALATADSPTTEQFVSRTCDKESRKCQNKSITACLGLEGSSLFILSDDDSPQKVNVTIFPLNITYSNIYISKHEVKKINISDNARGNAVCTIQMGVDVHKEDINEQFSSFGAYITPINGAYLLLISAVIIGGTFTCFKLLKSKRHLDGVPYRELEMGQSEFASTVNVETAEAWDQDWDDGWDEEKAVKPTSGDNATSRKANGHASRSSNSDGWGNDWDD